MVTLTLTYQICGLCVVVVFSTGLAIRTYVCTYIPTDTENTVSTASTADLIGTADAVGTVESTHCSCIHTVLILCVHWRFSQTLRESEDSPLSPQSSTYYSLLALISTYVPVVLYYTLCLDVVSL